jgi:hypothetical protein
MKTLYIENNKREYTTDYRWVRTIVMGGYDPIREGD